MRKIHIIGGGTVAHVRPHLALCAPAYGKVVRQLFDAITCSMDANEYLVHLYTTKMAGNRHQIWTARSGIEDEVYPPNLETNEDIAALLDHICVMQPEPSIVFLPAALCDFEPRLFDISPRARASGEPMPAGQGFAATGIESRGLLCDEL
jgi:hypothetical protein